MHVIQKLNLVAKTDVAFLNFGCAISITIVGMTRTNQLICAVKGIAQPDGSAVLGSQIIDAFLNGCSAMERMIVVTTATNCLKIARFASLKQTLSARTIDAFRSNGPVTLPMIVAMDLMSQNHSAKENIGNAQSLNSIVKMENAFQADGDVVSQEWLKVENFLL